MKAIHCTESMRSTQYQRPLSSQPWEAPQQALECCLYQPAGLRPASWNMQARSQSASFPIRSQYAAPEHCGLQARNSLVLARKYILIYLLQFEWGNAKISAEHIDLLFQRSPGRIQCLNPLRPWQTCSCKTPPPHSAPSGSALHTGPLKQ